MAVKDAEKRLRRVGAGVCTIRKYTQILWKNEREKRREREREKREERREKRGEWLFVAWQEST